VRKLVIASETIDQNVDFDVQSSFERSEAAEIEAKLRAGVKLGEFSHSLQDFCSPRFGLKIGNF
jgi:hypothetical protein